MKLKRTVCLVCCIFLFLCIATPIAIRGVTRKLIKEIEKQDYEAFQKTLKYSIVLDGLPYSRILCWLSQENYQTPLQVACKVGNYQMVKDLIEKGADVNNVNSFAPFSPLMCAVTSPSESNIEIVQLLLQNNVDVNYRKDAYDANALYQLMISKETIPNRNAIIDLLVDNGGDIYYAQKTYGNLLNVACANHNSEVIQHLLKKYDFDLNFGINGDTALICYCRNRYVTANVEDIKILLEHGADKTIVNNEGKTAYDYAVENDFTDIAELLK